MTGLMVGMPRGPFLERAAFWREKFIDCTRCIKALLCEAPKPHHDVVIFGGEMQFSYDYKMTRFWLLSVAAVIEVTTGIALITTPHAVSGLLLGVDLAGAGVAVGRVAGVALLSLGLMCWMSRQQDNKTPVLTAMLTYNLLVTIYLTYLGFEGQLVGTLLWPVIAIHTVLTLLFGYVVFNDRGPSTASNRY